MKLDTAEVQEIIANDPHMLYSGHGERSAQVLQHMEAIGYVNVYDAGALDEWPYDVVTTAEEQAVAAALAASDVVAHGGGCGCGHDHD